MSRHFVLRDLQVDFGAPVGIARHFVLCMSTNVDKKIASTEANIANTNVGSNSSRGVQPRLTAIHAKEA